MSKLRIRRSATGLRLQERNHIAALRAQSSAVCTLDGCRGPLRLRVAGLRTESPPRKRAVEVCRKSWDTEQFVAIGYWRCAVKKRLLLVAVALLTGWSAPGVAQTASF